MKLIARLRSLTQIPPSNTCSPEEREFVRKVSGAACNIRYCGRSDLVGLKIVGTHSGIRIEQAPHGRYARVLKMIRGREVITAEAHPLRVDRHKNVVISGIRDLVR